MGEIERFPLPVFEHERPVESVHELADVVIDSVGATARRERFHVLALLETTEVSHADREVPGGGLVSRRVHTDRVVRMVELPGDEGADMLEFYARQLGQARSIVCSTTRGTASPVPTPPEVKEQ